MEINKELNGTELTLKLEGQLDTLTAPELGKVIDESIEGLTLIRFDMSDLKYLSSAGLRVLMNTQKKMNEQGSMKVVGANETIMEVFDMTGLCDVFDIE